MDTSQFGMLIARELAREIGVSLVVSAPFMILFAQLSLAVREMAINSRKEYNSDDPGYDLTKWIGTAIVYIGIFSFIGGIGLLIRFS